MPLWSFWSSLIHVLIQEILFNETLENMGQHHGVLWHLDSASFHPGLSKWQLLVDLNTAPKGPPLLELPMGKQHHGLGWSPFVKSDAIACWITWPRRVVTTFIICMIIKSLAYAQILWQLRELWLGQLVTYVRHASVLPWTFWLVNWGPHKMSHNHNTTMP